MGELTTTKKVVTTSRERVNIIQDEGQTRILGAGNGDGCFCSR